MAGCVSGDQRQRGCQIGSIQQFSRTRVNTHSSQKQPDNFDKNMPAKVNSEDIFEGEMLYRK